MYSYEERLRAGELNIKLGKRLGASICELGYPTKNALKGWHRKYERWRDLQMSSAQRPTKFSAARKQVALEHYESHGRCISWTQRPLGCSCRATLTAWVREAFLEANTVSTTTYGAVNHSDVVKQAAVVGLTIAKKVPRPWPKGSELVGRSSMLGRPRSLARRLLP
jgi:putative transposase